MKTIFAIGFFLTIIVVFVFGFLKPGSDYDAQRQQLESLETEAVQSKAAIEGGDLGNSKKLMMSEASAARLFESAHDSGMRLEIIKNLFADGKDNLAKVLLKELEIRCGSKDQFLPAESTGDWVFEKVKLYCENYDSSLFNQLIHEGVQLSSLNPDIRALIKSDETDINLLSENFLNLLTEMKHNSTDFMADVSEVIEFFNSELGMSLALGQSNDQIFNIGKIQQVAAELYGCEKFGGCGSDSYQLLSYCFVDNRCEQGWSLTDYYQNTLSPVDYNEVMNILNFIRRHERGGRP